MKVELAGIGLDSPKKGFAGDPLFHEVLGLSKSPLSLSLMIGVDLSRASGSEALRALREQPMQ